MMPAPPQPTPRATRRAPAHDDGRYIAQYAADHCVCAYCWSPLAQRFDEESGMWEAVCSANEAHVGYHHIAFKDSEISKHSLTAFEIKEFYRETSFAAGFGLTPRLHGQALQDHVAALKRMLGRDDRLF
jgi:hypothetical protein